jgi:phytoene/squalene synthetase
MNTDTNCTFQQVDLEAGYRNCHLAVNKTFANMRWMVSNLPGSQRRDLDPLLYHLITIIDLLDLQSADGLSLDIWRECRNDLNQAFAGNCNSRELAALMDVAQRFQIPKQLLFDPLTGADLWIRQHRFATYVELEAFVAKVGGAMMAAMVPVLGFIKPGYEGPAVACGKGIMLTQLLANFVRDSKNSHVYLAEEDLESCEIEIHRVKLRKPMETLKHLVRLYCWRIEKLLNHGSQLLGHLDFDGRRSVTSLLGWTWTTMNQMRVNPDSILNESGVLTRHDLFRLKAKHFLGLEGRLPFEVESNHHH